MLHHECDALEGYPFFWVGEAISFYSVSRMYKVIFKPSLLNWSSGILAAALLNYVHKYFSIKQSSSLFVWNISFDGVPHLGTTGIFVDCNCHTNYIETFHDLGQQFNNSIVQVILSKCCKFSPALLMHAKSWWHKWAQLISCQSSENAGGHLAFCDPKQST